MFVANLAALAFTHMSTMAAWFFQEQAAVGWDPISLWHQMGIRAKAVVIILFVMSGWSIGVMIDRCHGVQRRPQTVARVRSRRGRRPARWQD